MRLLKGFSDAGEIEGEGTPEERKAVQERQRGEKLQRDQRERIAMNGRCIARADLTDGPLGLLEDITDGAPLDALAAALVRVDACNRPRATGDDAGSSDRARRCGLYLARICARQPRRCGAGRGRPDPVLTERVSLIRARA